MKSVLKRLTMIAAAVVGGGMLWSAPAAAQATRTWVSGVGDDVNPCSRTAPCKTFAGAISKTAAGGEIDCLDPGGFGALTITKSITIDCSGTFGSVLASGINGFNVNDSASGSPNTARVILRGLSINGAGTTPGAIGINFTSGASLEVDHVIVQNFTTGTATGILFKPSANASMVLNNVVVANSGQAATTTSAAVTVAPALGVRAIATIKHSQLSGNPVTGARFDATAGAGTSIVATVEDTVMDNNATGLQSKSGTGTTAVTATASSMSNNSAFGINTNGATSTVRIAGSTLTGNDNSIQLSNGGQVVSLGNNFIDGNNANTLPTSTIAPH